MKSWQIEMLEIASKLVLELTRPDFEGSTVRELVMELQEKLDEESED